jgi:hypothetical protein
LELAEPAAEFVATGLATSLLETALVPSGDLRLVGLPGQRAPPIAVNAPEGVSGVLTYWFDTTDLPDDAEIAVLHFDEGDLDLDVPAGQVVDPAAGTVTVPLTEFSPFVVVDVTEFAKIWDRELGGGPGTPGAERQSVDVMLAIDSSGSMSTNDPGRLRVAAAALLIDALQDGDRVGVVDFDSTARLLRPLSSDLQAAKDALGRVRAAGGTSLSAPMSLALSRLDSIDWKGASRAIVLLTDGVGAYDPVYTQWAKDRGIVVYTVGLGRATDEALLDQIATETGGKFYLADSADDLAGVFRTGVTPEIVGADLDGDGLADRAEVDGMLTSTGKVLYSDPEVFDTDGDGLGDGLEMGYDPSPGHAFGRGTAYRVYSDPGKADSDGDGLDDLIEVTEYLFPWDPDYDHDGANDAEEYAAGSSPLLVNSDVDQWTDKEEIDDMNAGGGKDPTITDTVFEPDAWHNLFARGFFCGDWEWPDWFCDSNEWPYTAGMIARGFVPGVDLVDLAWDLPNGEWAAAGLSLVGLVPLFGDTIKGGVKAIARGLKPGTKLAKRMTKLLDEDLDAFEAIDNLRLVAGTGPARMTAKQRKEAFKTIDEFGGGAATEMIKRYGYAGVDEARFITWAANGMSPHLIKEIFEQADEVVAAPKMGYRTERQWETYHRLENPDALAKQRRIALPDDKYFLDGAPPASRTTGRPQAYRLKDLEDLSAGLSSEYKVGRITIRSGQTAVQLLIDGAIGRAIADPASTYAADVGFTEQLWEFFPNQLADGIVGPDSRVLDQMLREGIHYKIWI